MLRLRETLRRRLVARKTCAVCGAARRPVARYLRGWSECEHCHAAYCRPCHRALDVSDNGADWWSAKETLIRYRTCRACDAVMEEHVRSG